MQGVHYLEKKKLYEICLVELREFQLKCLLLEQDALDAMCHFRAHLCIGQCLSENIR